MTTMNNRLQVTFHQQPQDLGWIDMNVVWPSQPGADGGHAYATRASCARMSAVFCPFAALISWMDAVARNGDEPAAIAWDDEGREVELVYESGRLFYSNRNHEGWWHADIPAREVAATFYTAFRDFVHSGYDRTRYESVHCLREVFLKQARGHVTLTQLLLSIAALPGDRAARRFAELARDHHQIRAVVDEDGKLEFLARRAKDLFDPRFVRRWDLASRSRRLKLLRRFLSFRIYSEWSETALRSLRSRLIERHVLPAFRDD